MSTKKKVTKPVKKAATKTTVKKAPAKVSKPVKKTTIARKPIAAKPAAKPVKKTAPKATPAKKVATKKTTAKTAPVKKITAKAVKPAPKAPVKKVTGKPVKAPAKVVKPAPKASPKPVAKTVKPAPKVSTKPALKKAPLKTVKAAPVKSPAKKQVPLKVVETKKTSPPLAPKINVNIQKRPVNDGGKQRLIISYKNLTQEQLDAWREKYPRGYSDYMSDIMRFDKPDGSFFYYVILELPNTTLLVKVDVKVDSDYEEVEKEIFSGSSDPVGEMGSSPTALVNAYRSLGIEDLEFVLYPGARHEALNETNRDEVMDNLLSWICRRNGSAVTEKE